MCSPCIPIVLMAEIRANNSFSCSLFLEDRDPESIRNWYRSSGRVMPNFVDAQDVFCAV